MQVQKNSGQKVLIISAEFPPGPGGIGNHAYNLAKSLHAKPHLTVTVMADSNYTSLTEIQEFDDTVSFAIHRIHRRRPVFLTYLNRITTAIKLVGKNDQIICSGKFSLWIGGLLSLFFSSKKYIAVVHGSELDKKNKIVRQLTTYSLSKMDRIIAVSHYTKSFLNKHLPGIVIPNGIDTAAFEANGVTATTKGSLHLLTVGNVTPRKGQQNMIKALPMVIKDLPHVHYHMVGLPTKRDELISLARNLGVADHITFHGRVSQGDLKKRLQESDIFVMLSEHTAKGDFEGFGIAILEANIYGKPAIGSINSGITDAIDQGRTGYLVDPHQPEAIADALKKIIADYENYSINAKAWALKHDWEMISNMYSDVIEEV